MDVVFIVVAVVIILFGFVILFGAPFLPTLSERVEEALDLLDLKAGQTLLELGSGDGRLLIAAAKWGIHAVGYELNPLLFAYAWLRSWRYRGLITVRFGDYWRSNWPPADGIYVFLLQPYMGKLHKKIIQYNKRGTVRVVSFAFRLPKKQPREEQNGLFLYTYTKR